MCNDLWLPVANVIPAMKKWPASEESTKTGVNLAYKQDLAWFDFIQQDEVFAKRYNLAMQAHGGGEGYSIQSVINGYPWGKLPQDATVVDVSLLQSHPLYSKRHIVAIQDESLTEICTRWAATKATSPSPSQKPFRASPL